MATYQCYLCMHDIVCMLHAPVVTDSRAGGTKYVGVLLIHVRLSKLAPGTRFISSNTSE